RASDGPKALVATDNAGLVADLLSGAREEIAVDASAVATTPDAAKLAFGRQQGQVQVVEVASKRILHQIDGANARVTSVALSEDGALLVVGLDDGRVQIHRLAAGTEKLADGLNHVGAVTAVAGAAG